MRKAWTTSPERGAELLVALRRAAGVPLRAQLEEAIRAAIRDGRLTPGERLPSSRTLATDLGVARGVVVEAYAQLTAEGWLTAEHGSGTRVSERALAERTAVVPAAPAPTGARAPAGPSVTHGVAPGDPPVRWDFRPGLPDLAAFPRQAWVAATRRVLAGLPAARLGYGDPAGTPELRAALAAYLGRVRGVLAAPDRVIVCTGFGQALGLVAGVLADRGLDRMAVEDPLNQDEPSILARAGLTPVPVPVDDLGLDVDALAATGVRAAMLTPAHQFPTGVVLAPRRRAALIDWARARDGLVVEDDYDAEYRYDRGPVGAVQGLDPERVAYAGSVSRRWPRLCGWAGWWSRPAWSPTWLRPSGSPTTAPRRWTSSSWPTCSARAPTTITCAAPAAVTAPAATCWPGRWPGSPRGSPCAGSRPGSTSSSSCPPVPTRPPSPPRRWPRASGSTRCAAIARARRPCSRPRSCSGTAASP